MKIITKYTELPAGFVQIKTGLVQPGDVIHYAGTSCIEDCAGLIGKPIASLSTSKVYRAPAKVEAKHTPGPWTYIYSGTCLDLKGNNSNTLIAEFPTLASEYGTAYKPREEDAANLELIRSAPDLLRERDEAVSALKELMRCFVGDRDSQNCIGESGIVAEKARSILNRMESEQTA